MQYLHEAKRPAFGEYNTKVDEQEESRHSPLDYYHICVRGIQSKSSRQLLSCHAGVDIQQA